MKFQLQYFWKLKNHSTYEQLPIVWWLEKFSLGVMVFLGLVLGEVVEEVVLVVNWWLVVLVAGTMVAGEPHDFAWVLRIHYRREEFLENKILQPMIKASPLQERLLERKTADWMQQTKVLQLQRTESGWERLHWIPSNFVLSRLLTIDLLKKIIFGRFENRNWSKKQIRPWCWSQYVSVLFSLHVSLEKEKKEKRKSRKSFPRHLRRNKKFAYCSYNIFYY